MPLDPALPTGTRLVLDTNTVLALWLFEDPALIRLRTAIESRRFVLISRDDCLEELQHTLRYPQFKADEARQQQVCEAYRAVLSERATPLENSTLPRCRDADDQKFLETAWGAEAQALVSRDKAVLRAGRHRVYRERFTTLTPEQLEALLSATPQD